MGTRFKLFFVHFICIAWLLLGVSCALTAGDLRYSHPGVPVIRICDKPLDVPNDVKLWGYEFTTGRLVTGENPAELRLFDAADVFFEYDREAPESSASEMPSEYGLTCVKSATSFPDASELFFPPSSELFRVKEPCPAQVVEADGRPDPRLLASPPIGKAKKSPAKAAPTIVHVCVRPPGTSDKLKQWASRDVEESLLTTDDKVFADAVAKTNILFVYNPDALAASACWFTADPAALSCPGKPIPKACNQTLREELFFSATGISVYTGTSCATSEPKKGAGKTTTTSSPDGKGPPLNFLETLAHNLAIAGSLASGDTSGSLKDPNGSRHGIPAGKNVGGPDSAVLQAAVGTFAIIGIPFKSGKEFIERLIRGSAEKKVAVILDVKVLSKEIAEELAKDPIKSQIERAEKGEIVESYGLAMAMSLRDAGAIMPYSRAQIFTAGWETKYQAHHILEVNMFEKIGKLEMAKDGPAVILSKAEHDAITKDLRDATKKMLDEVERAGRKLQPADVWQMYQKVYMKYPNWLQAIEHYFQ